MLRIPEDKGSLVKGYDEDGKLEFQNDIVSGQPEQREIDRDLAIYDTYSHR